MDDWAYGCAYDCYELRLKCERMSDNGEGRMREMLGMIMMFMRRVAEECGLLRRIKHTDTLTGLECRALGEEQRIRKVLDARSWGRYSEILKEEVAVLGEMMKEMREVGERGGDESR